MSKTITGWSFKALLKLQVYLIIRQCQSFVLWYSEAYVVYKSWAPKHHKLMKDQKKKWRINKDLNANSHSKEVGGANQEVFESINSMKLWENKRKIVTEYTMWCAFVVPLRPVNKGTERWGLKLIHSWAWTRNSHRAEFSLLQTVYENITSISFLFLFLLLIELLI